MPSAFPFQLSTANMVEHWVLLLLGLVTSCVVSYQQVREQFYGRECCNHLKEIGLALSSYYNTHGTFPPAYVCGKAGKPVNSWRTLIVPGRLWYTFPPAFDYAERWDSARTQSCLRESEKAREHSQCPAAGCEEPAITNYVAVIGANTMWPGCGAGRKAADGSDDDEITGDRSHKLRHSLDGTTDLTLAQALETIQGNTSTSIGSRHRHGIHYLTVGGEVRTLDSKINRESLRKLLVRDRVKAPSPKGGR